MIVAYPIFAGNSKTPHALAEIIHYLESHVIVWQLAAYILP
jgi:hypothetical protein